MRTRAGCGTVRAALTATIAAGIAIIALSGCVREEQPVLPTSSPTSSPVFATDAEALAAARKAYAGYLAAEDSVGTRGGKNASSLRDFVSAAWLGKELHDARLFERSGQHISGHSTFSRMTLESLQQSASGQIRLTIYVCRDVGKVRIRDASGNDITPSRANVVPLQIDFVGSSLNQKTLMLDRSEAWAGQNFCE
jgi:hypothetical protein